MNNIDKRMIEIEEQTKKLYEERSKLFLKNLEVKFDGINNFLKENLGDIEFKINASSIDKIRITSIDEDTVDMKNFISKCIELYTPDPTNNHGHFSLHLYDDEIQVYASSRYDKLEITIHRHELLNKFLYEYNINKLSFEFIDKTISDYELKVNELKKLKDKFSGYA